MQSARTQEQEITEGEVTLFVERPKIVSKDMKLFYNPVMRINREMTLAILQTRKEPSRIADPLAGTGIRTMRILKEIPGCVEHIVANDLNPASADNFFAMCKMNNIDTKKASFTTADANKMLLDNPFFDYIDVDPFGSPVDFLDCALKRLKLGGYLAVTATDTAALCGTSVKACRRKYWAEPLRTGIMKEVAVRILIRRVQLVAAAQEISVTPILSYPHEHYFRVFFRRDRSGSERIDRMLSYHKTMSWCNTCGFLAQKECANHNTTAFGPIWTGPLHDPVVVENMLGFVKHEETKDLLLSCLLDSSIDTVGFVDIHALCKKHKYESPSFEKIILEMEKQGGRAVRTPFSITGIRTTLSGKEVNEIVKKMQKKKSA